MGVLSENWGLLKSVQPVNMHVMIRASDPQLKSKGMALRMHEYTN